MSENLKKKTIDAIQWLAIDRFGQQAIQLIVGLVLARHLEREEFGLISTVMIFIALGFVFVESGFSQALIQKQKPTQKDYNSVFYFNLVVSISIYMLLFFSAPLISKYYNQPSLTLICRIIFLAIPLNSLYLVSFVQINRDMNFKKMAIANVSGVCISGAVGISMALMDMGVWALVVQQLLSQLIRVISYFIMVKWRPKLIFSFQVIRSFWSYSIHLLFTALLNVVFNNIFYIILGRSYSIKQSGDFYQANKLNESVNYSFQIILAGSSFSLFVKLQDDIHRLQNAFRTLAQKSSIVTFPVVITLIAVAKPLIITLLSEKWTTAIPYYQALGLASLFSVLYALSVNMLNAIKFTKLTFWLELTKKVLILLAIFAGFVKGGVMIMLFGYVIASFVSYIISMVLIRKKLNYGYLDQISNFIRPLLFGVFLALIVTLLSFVVTTNYQLLFALQTITSIAIYMLWIFIRHRELYNEALTFIKRKINSIKSK